METQIYPQQENITLKQRGVIKRSLRISGCTLEILNSQIDVIIVGERNKIKIQESAGKINFVGSQNHISIVRSWVACKIEGNHNQFNISETQFQLISHKGEENLIPGILGQQQLQIRRRLMNERVLNIRLALKLRSQHIKRLLPHLRRSNYNSETRQCSICYDDIKTGEEVTALFCFHFFHSSCILACLQSSVKCPVCSLDLLKVINEEMKIGNFVQHKGEIVLKESMEIEQS